MAEITYNPCIETSHAQSVMQYLFGRIPLTDPPTSYWLGLSTTNIGTDGSGATEPAASTGYVRKELPNNTATFQTSATGETSNRNQITFPEATASYSAALKEWFLCTAETGTPPTVLFHGAFDEDKVIQTGYTP